MIKTSYDFIRAYSKFIKRLNNTIPKISDGGCGEFAMMIKDKLSTMEGVKVNGIRCVTNKTTMNPTSIDISIKDNLLTHVRQNGMWNHFLVEIEYNNVTLWVDSDDVCAPEDHYLNHLVYDGMFCEQELSIMLVQPIWNTLFKRSNLPKMKKFIQEYVFV